MPGALTYTVGGGPAETLSSMFAAAYQLPANYTLTVTDDNNPGSHVVTFTGNSLWYRTFLAKRSGAAGTWDDPGELLAALTTIVNAGGTLWTFALGPNGLPYVRYAGTTTDGAIAWTTAGALEAQLGFTSSIAIAHGTNGVQTAAYLPNHCAFAYRRDNDTGWQERMPRGVFSTTGGGLTYGQINGLGGMRRGMDLSAHPYDWATRQSNGMNATPAFDDESGWASVNAALGVGPAGFSLRQFFQYVASAPGGTTRLAAALGNFQALVAGTDLTFHECCLSAAGSTGEAKTSPFQPRSGQLYTRKGVELEWISKGSR